MTTALAPVRSALFVPATRPDRIAKALASGADAVIVDLEDAVPATEKAAARDNLRHFLEEQPDVRVCVRINPAFSAEHEADLALCCRHPGVGTVLLPKAEPGAGLKRLAATGKPIWLLIESAAGLVGLHELAGSAGVERLALGTLDLAQDLALVAEQEPAMRALDHARFELVVHSRAAARLPPIDGVFPALRDDAGLASAAAHARAVGFGGMFCIHPHQVPVVNAAFAPTAVELDWARRVLEATASGQGVAVVDGEMVDAPVIARARGLLAHT